MITRHTAILVGRRTLLCLWLLSACHQAEPKPSAPGPQKSSELAGHETAVEPAIRSGVPADQSAPHNTAESTLDRSAITRHNPASDTTPTAEAVDLKPVIKRILARDVFKLSPTTVQAYFEPIATLRPAPAAQTYLKDFVGTSTSPWLSGAYVELTQESEKKPWRLGQAILAWTPPKLQARALYKRLVAEVQTVLGRKPNFGSGEGETRGDHLSAGWTWCKESCEAVIELDGSDPASFGLPLKVEDTQSIVQVRVYVPEGP